MSKKPLNTVIGCDFDTLALWMLPGFGESTADLTLGFQLILENAWFTATYSVPRTYHCSVSL